MENPEIKHIREPDPRPRTQPQPRRRRVDRRALLCSRLSIICLAVLLLAFALTSALLLVLPRSTKSLIEKRDLATFPKFTLESYFSGDFTAGVATWYDDTVPNHDGLKNLGNSFKRLFGLPKSEDSVQFVGKIDKIQDRAPAEGPTPAPVNSGADNNSPGTAGAPLPAGAAGRNMTPDASNLPAPTADPFPNGAVEQRDIIENIMIIKQDGHWRGMEMFAGGGGDSYASALNDLRSKVDPSVNIWSMPAPLPCQFYTPKEYKEYVADQSQCFDNVHAKLGSGITPLNVCAALAAHAEEPIYCRTDHHWQPLGAYYAAEAFASAAGVPFADIGSYTSNKIENSMGTMYAWSKSADLLSDPEDFTYYLPGVPYSAVYYNQDFSFAWDDDDLFGAEIPEDPYVVYLGSDQYIVKVTTEVQNGRKLLIMKDSYGNATVPFYTSSFGEIYVADIRYMERNLVSMIRDLGITDVVFTVSAFSVVGENAGHIQTLIDQNAGETVTDPYPQPGPTTAPPAAE
ncbi:DHHW family protein [Acutalibacter muris]|uniref:DHHW family protein n=1 Tax=Acutalibacter muris TaxID=1796620 RepID=UPI0026F3E82A|nr:DHHW family protein [Acutalibacter muris]